VGIDISAIHEILQIRREAGLRIDGSCIECLLGRYDLLSVYPENKRYRLLSGCSKKDCTHISYLYSTIIGENNGKNLD